MAPQLEQAVTASVYKDGRPGTGHNDRKEQISMKRMRIIGLALVAMFALTAVAATSSASAATCGEAGTLPCFKGPYPKAFKSTSGAGTLETVGKKTVKCTADTNTGSVTGEKTDEVTVTFTGCTSSGVKCNTAGAAAGEIKTKLLKSTLGYLSKEAKTVGVLLQPKEGEFFVEFECTGFAKSKVRGAVIGKVTPVNTSTTKFTDSFKQTSGKQEFTKLEGESTAKILESSLDGGAFEQAGEETSDELTLSEASEIKA